MMRFDSWPRFALPWVLVAAITTPALAQEPGDREPIGAAGWRARPIPGDEPGVLPYEDRWRLGFPEWDRHPGREGAYPYERGRLIDPFNQNILKGDYPVYGDDIFFVGTVISDTLLEGRSIPTPVLVSAADQKGSEKFFGRSEQFFFNENLVVSLELFKGSTAFKPRDWEIRITPVFNFNYVDIGERNAVNFDPREGTTRDDGHVGMQELFVEYHIADVSPWYDFVASRFGIQGFTSDFRGLIFSDNNLGVRFMGNYESNRQQYNLAWFHQLEKDTNSTLNILFKDDFWRSRQQDVFVANYYRQDTIWYGYTAQLSFHYNRDHADRPHFDDNGFIARPAAIGSVVGGGIGSNGEFDARLLFHDVDAYYLGWAGEGHIGRINVSHAFYQVLGQDDLNPLAGRQIDINAQLAFAELSIDRDWMRFKGTFFWASGDPDPTDGVGRGFDTILDNMFVGGAGFSYWNRQALPMTGTRVFLVNRLSLLPSLRSTKIEGQPNFVNPGIFLYGVGTDLELTPKLRAFVNVNYLMFHETAPLEELLEKTANDEKIGFDYSLGLNYRPLLIDNIILFGAAAGLTPDRGFRDLFVSETLFSAFVGATLTF